MSNDTHETASTWFVQVGNVRFAYRRFGRPGGLPLLLLNYFAANMDNWDPKVTNGFAAEREVILLDNAGVGGSSGETPSTVAAMTKECVDFCRALDLKNFDVVGFSLGGMIAQHLAFEYPDMIRRMILMGTGPRGGEGMTFTELSTDLLADPVALLLSAFFTPSEASKTAGRAYIERLKLRVADRDAPVSTKAAGAQLEAIRNWGSVPSTDRFAMLPRIHQRTLIVHGSKDIVVLPINAFLLAQHLPDAQLVMYPDASHGAQSQHAEVFLQHARLFLDG
jgi:pimeloyl-ACP methyl ester carboxylesterase